MFKRRGLSASQLIAILSTGLLITIIGTCRINFQSTEYNQIQHLLNTMIVKSFNIELEVKELMVTKEMSTTMYNIESMVRDFEMMLQELEEDLTFQALIQRDTKISDIFKRITYRWDEKKKHLEEIQAGVEHALGLPYLFQYTLASIEIANEITPDKWTPDPRLFRLIHDIHNFESPQSSSLSEDLYNLLTYSEQVFFSDKINIQVISAFLSVIILAAVLIIIVIHLKGIKHQNHVEKQKTKELIRINQEINRSKERLTLAMRGAEDGLWDWKKTTGDFYINTKLLEILGYERGELKNTIEGWKSLIHPDDLQNVDNAMERHFSGKEKSYKVELRLQNKKGDWKWFLDRGQVVEKDEEGKPTRVTGLLTDISYRKELEKKLEDNQQRLNLAVKGAQIGLWDWNLETGKTYYSDYAYKTLGYENTDLDLTKEVYLDMVHPDDRPHVEQRIESYLEGDSLEYKAEYRLKAKDGTWRWVYSSGGIVEKDRSGSPRRFAGTILDITRQKEMELQRNERERFIAKITRTSPSIMYIYDIMRNKTIYTNKHILPLLGYREGYMDPQEAVSILSLMHPDDMVLIENHYRWLENAGMDEIYDIEYRLKAADGSYHWFFSKETPFLKDGSGKTIQVLGNMQDITDQKEASHIREQLIRDLEDKNSELERFTYTVSHDLKGPIVTIKGFMGMLRRDLKGGKTSHIEKDMQRIANATDKMSDLLDDILELSRIGRAANPPESFSTLDMVTAISESFSHDIIKRNINVSIDQRLPVIIADRLRIREVFLNLIENAVKFSDEKKEQSSIEIGFKKYPGEKILFFVKDNGIGVEMEYRKKVFELSQKLDSHTDGSGLGLYLARRIVEVHSGNLKMYSNGPGEGCIFYFSLGWDLNTEEIKPELLSLTQ